MKNKVLFVIPSPLSFKIFLSDLVLELKKRDFEVLVVCNKYDEECYIDGVQYHFLNFPRDVDLFKYLNSARELAKVIRLSKPTLIHSHFSTAAILTFLSRFKGFPYSITTIQGVIYTMQKSGFSKLKYMIPEIWAYKSFDKTFVLTEDDHTKLHAYIPHLEKQYSPGFGCNIQKFNPDNLSIKNSLIRKHLKIDKDAKVLIYIGRLVKFKGFDIALKAFLDAKKEIPNLIFIVCGSFDKIHPSGLTSEEKDILRNDDSIIWKGFVDNVEEYLSIADLNIFPSTREGMPVNLMESIVMGVPVITSNFRGCKHVVENYFTGRIVTKHNALGYAEVIVEMLKDEEQLKIYRRNCMAMRLFFDRSRYINETLQVYTTIMKTNSIKAQRK